MTSHKSIVPLVRQFSPTFPPSEDETGDGEVVHPYLFGKSSSGWEEIEEKRRCVIIADAGAGKTHEMLTRAGSVANFFDLIARKSIYDHVVGAKYSNRFST